MGKQVTMRDIAEALGVSTVSVSKALGDKEGVSDEVREQIKEKAREMGYRYSASSKVTSAMYGGVFGVIVADRFFKDSSFYHDMYTKLSLELSKEGYMTVLEVVSANEEKEGRLPNCVASGSVNGLVIIGKLSRSYIKNIRATGITYSFLDFYDERENADAVVSDGVYGSYLLTNHLIEKGHTEIAYVGDINATGSIMDRYLGYYKAMLENGYSVKKEWLISDRDEKGRFIDMVFPKKMPTAFVCNNDEVAYLVIKKLNQMGYRVPTDVSVTGFDDYIYATLSEPKLTTFKVDTTQMVQLITAGIRKKLEDPDFRQRRVMISGEVVYRDSVAERK